MRKPATKPARPRRSARAKAPTTPDPIEIAMEAEASDVAADSPARLLLIDSRRLVRWQIASEQAGVAVKLLTAAAGLTGALGLAVLAWQASQADGIVLEPFTVPATLQADGVNGEVVASQVLDELSRLRAETTSVSRAREYGDDWGRDIKLMIPSAGITLGDLQTALRQWLGHETHITGEVYRTPGGLALRARVRGGQPLRVVGSPGDPEPLAQALGRAIYRETQPARYARWLADHADLTGAITEAQRAATVSKDPRDRAEAYSQLSYALNLSERFAEAVPPAQRARALAPDWWYPAYALATYEINMGHMEAAARHMRDAVRLRPGDRSLPKPERGVAFYRARVALLENDFGEAVRQYQLAEQDPAMVALYGIQLDRGLVTALAQTHDIQGAYQRLNHPLHDEPWRTAFNLDQMIGSRSVILRMSEDWPGQLGMVADGRLGPVAAFNVGNWSMVGLAQAESGDVAAGLTTLAPLPADCDGCSLNRARALGLAGRYAEADGLAASVEARSPSLPAASFLRGRIALDAGNPAGAIVHLREAHRRQPRWAEPLSYEGDALARLGRWQEAEAAYAKADPLAPKWGGLQLRWGEALGRLGKPNDAQARWRTAARLYLTPTERARVTALLAPAKRP